jgi:hypothetical protein
MTDYGKIFKENPIKTSEPTTEYYKRIAKKIKKSPRTIGDQYNKWLKISKNGIFDQIGSIKAYNKMPKEIEKALTDTLKTLYTKEELTKEESARVWKNIEKELDKPKRNIHVLFGCTHIPYENIELLNKITTLCEDLKDKLSGFHIMGDFLDMLAFSRHNINQVTPHGYTIGIEYERANTWLDIFDSVLPKDCRKTYGFGNHESHFERHFQDINNSVFKDATISPQDALKLTERGYEVYTDWREDFVQIGNLSIHHGFLLGQNPCKQHLDKMKVSNAFVHTHRIGSHFDGELSSYNLGCTADLNSPGMKYASRIERMNWANGFGVCYVNEDGSFQMNVIRVNKDNSFWFGNKKY